MKKEIARIRKYHLSKFLLSAVYMIWFLNDLIIISSNSSCTPHEMELFNVEEYKKTYVFFLF